MKLYSRKVESLRKAFPSSASRRPYDVDVRCAMAGILFDEGLDHSEVMELLGYNYARAEYYKRRDAAMTSARDKRYTQLKERMFDKWESLRRK